MQFDTFFPTSKRTVLTTRIAIARAGEPDTLMHKIVAGIVGVIGRQQYGAFQERTPRPATHLPQMIVERTRSKNRPPQPTEPLPVVVESPTFAPRVQLRWRPSRTGRGLEMHWETDQAA